MQTEPPVLTFENVSVRYTDGTQAVRGVSFQVNKGECLALVGESGSGKTTIARAALGLLPEGTKVFGSIVLSSTSVIDAPPEELRRLRGLVAGFVAQDPFGACNPLLRVSDHVAEAWRVHGQNPAVGIVTSMLESLGVANASVVVQRYPHEWSGGMLQRATIAAANAHQPQLIIADEPTSALDADRADATIELLRSTGAALLLVSHNLDLVSRHAERIAVCYQGVIVEIGKSNDVIKRPRQQYTKDLIAATTQAVVPKSTAKASMPVLEAVGLSRTYQTGNEIVRAVVSADLSVRRGEIVGICGESGSGKSTLLRLIATIEVPTAGTVSLDGQLITSGDSNTLLDARARRGFVMPIFQDPVSSLDNRWPIWRTVTEPLIAKHRNARPSRSERRRIACERLEQVGLLNISLDARPHELSIGQCQRVSIARALIAEPSLIVADEPTSALDTITTTQVLRLLALASDQGTAIVIVSHDRSLLTSLAHRVLMMRAGRLSST